MHIAQYDHQNNEIVKSYTNDGREAVDMHCHSHAGM